MSCLKHNDVTIVIQGPINKTTLFAIAKYRQLAEIIIVHSSDCNDPNYLKFKDHENLKIITYRPDEVSKYVEKIRTCNGNQLHACF